MSLQSVRRKGRTTLLSIHNRTPDKFETWKDYAFILVLAGIAWSVVAVALSPLYVFYIIGETYFAGDALLFSIGCYLMFLLLVASRWS